MITYPGLPGPEITDHLSREASRARYAPGTQFHIARISMIANTGTYLDTPSHRFADGADLSGVGLERLVDLDGIVIDARTTRAIGRSDHDVRGRAVLFRTGWDRHWRTDQYGSGAPFLMRDGASWLAESDAALVGIDSVNIDDTADGTRPAHSSPSTSTIRRTERAPRTRSCSGQGSRSSNTCAVSTNSRRPASASTPRRRWSAAWERFRCALTRSSPGSFTEAAAASGNPARRSPPAASS